MNRALPGIALTFMLVLAGCGSDESGDATPAAPASTSSVVGSTDPECQVLSDAEVEEFMGDPVKSRWPDPAPLPGCRWTTESGAALAASSVSAVTSVEEIWVALAMTSLTGRRDEREERSFRRQQRQLVDDFGPVTPETVCDLLLQMGELVGFGNDDLNVAFLPSLEEPQVATGRGCRDGTFVSTTYSAPALADADAVANMMREVMGVLLSRRSR